MNLFNLKIACWIAALSVFVPRLAFAQSPSGQSRSAPRQKLEVETIATIPLEERRSLLAALTPREREKFFQQFRKLPPGDPSNAKINALFMAWSAVDGETATESAKKLPTVDARRAAIEAICYGAKPEATAGIVRSIKRFPDNILLPEQKERFLGSGIVKWSQTDPAAAAQFLSELYPDAARRLAEPGERDGVLVTTTQSVAANWGGISPIAALAWFEKKWPGNFMAMKGVISGWWRKDAKAAAAYVGAHTNTPNERELAGMLAAPMAEQDPRIAVSWAEWIKDEKLRRRTRLGIAELWASRDAKGAGEWARDLSGKEGESAIGVVAGVWAFSDSTAAEKWIANLPERSRDTAIRGFAITMARKNEETALNWVLKMQDKEARERLTKAIAAEWRKHSPGQLRSWIQKSELSEEEKKELLEDASTDD